MTKSVLFSSYTRNGLNLANRVVMSPMTRCRAVGNIPNDLSIDYYTQRAGAGLIVTEGTSPSPNGLGNPRMPGVFNAEQVQAWQKITASVHKAGGKIFVQMMHNGRVAHANNLPAGARVIAPSEVKIDGQIYTDSAGLVDYPTPSAMSLEDITKTQDEFAQSSALAVEAGFDGIEFHGANGYLIEQFLSPLTNQRQDIYGGSIENRCRFLLEALEKAIKKVGKEKIGLRLSPYGVANSMQAYPETEEEYTYLAKELNKLGITYVHLVDHAAMGSPAVPESIKKMFRREFKNTLILSGGYTKERAELDLQQGNADLIAFGRPFITNPDLVKRMENDWPLNLDFDRTTFYSPGSKGYTDYPVYQG